MRAQSRPSGTADGRICEQHRPSSPPRARSPPAGARRANERNPSPAAAACAVRGLANPHSLHNARVSTGMGSESDTHRQNLPPKNRMSNRASERNHKTGAESNRSNMEQKGRGGGRCRHSQPKESTPPMRLSPCALKKSTRPLVTAYTSGVAVSPRVTIISRGITAPAAPQLERCRRASVSSKRAFYKAQHIRQQQRRQQQ